MTAANPPHHFTVPNTGTATSFCRRLQIFAQFLHATTSFRRTIRQTPRLNHQKGGKTHRYFFLTAKTLVLLAASLFLYTFYFSKGRNKACFCVFTFCFTCFLILFFFGFPPVKYVTNTYTRSSSAWVVTSVWQWCSKQYNSAEYCWWAAGDPVAIHKQMSFIRCLNPSSSCTVLLIHRSC